MKKLLFSLIYITFCNYFVIAQGGMSEHTWRISYEPQYLIINGIKLNIEKRLQKPTDWLILSPSLYYKEYETVDISEYDYTYDNGFTTTKNIKAVKGAGLTVENRLLLTSPTFSRSLGFSIAPYFSYGATYTFFEITREDSGWIEIVEDGVPYMYEDFVQSKTNIHKTGLNFTLGLQAEVIEDVIAEFYLGCGIRYSFYEGDKKYNKSSMDYGFKGVLLLGGIKIGVGF
jgi:hypothetical protein